MVWSLVMIKITWAALHNFYLLTIVIGVFLLLLYRYKAKKKAILLLGGKWSGTLVKNFSSKKQLLRIIFLSTGLFFLWLALLRPQWGKVQETIHQQGRDLFIGLDVSRSMLATDCAPNRLQCAKEKIKKMLPLLGCERVGLILFSGSAFVQCPLTSDYHAFHMFLDAVDVETISSGTTALDQAINKALQTYETLPERKTKLLVLFTDGEDFSTNLQQIKRKAKEKNLHIFTVGVGTPEGAPIPLYNEYGKQLGHQKDGHDKIVITKLNEAMLHSLALDAGGQYVRISQDNNDMHKLVSLVAQYEKEDLHDKKIGGLIDRYSYFLLVSFICFAFEWLL